MKVDMSAKAVTVRLRRVSQLRHLCVALGKGKGTSLEGPRGSSRTADAVGGRLDFDGAPFLIPPASRSIG